MADSSILSPLTDTQSKKVRDSVYESAVTDIQSTLRSHKEENERLTQLLGKQLSEQIARENQKLLRQEAAQRKLERAQQEEFIRQTLTQLEAEKDFRARSLEMLDQAKEASEKNFETLLRDQRELFNKTEQDKYEIQLKIQSQVAQRSEQDRLLLQKNN